jgi:hypothetical protein
MIDQTRDDSPRPSLLAEVDLLKDNYVTGKVFVVTNTACLYIKSVCIRVLFDYWSCGLEQYEEECNDAPSII